tara:strand:+ start:257 stop:1045 length:789 start_codon:yes stop_codon:yes gene_type:complete
MISEKVSVLIRNKNQESALSFLLRNLTERYDDDIDEIILLDNNSTDNSVKIAGNYNVKVVPIHKFGYGSSANTGAAIAKSRIVVIFSAHAYPISHDFFKQIIKRFEKNKNLAGLRCLHNRNDFKAYINKMTAKDDPRQAGLIFCGSAFNRDVWKNNRFKPDIITMEDKEWSIRVLNKGFEIDFVPSIFCYDISRSRSQEFFRFKSETYGSYDLWNTRFGIKNVLRGFVMKIILIFYKGYLDILYTMKMLLFQLKFLIEKRNE